VIKSLEFKKVSSVVQKSEKAREDKEIQWNLSLSKSKKKWKRFEYET
jgi:hypothetical protein